MPLGPSTNDLLYCSDLDDAGQPCPTLALARGLCRRHYQRRYNKGQLPKRTKRPKSVSFTVRLPEKIHSGLTKISRASGRTLIALVEDAIVAYLKSFNVS